MAMPPCNALSSLERSLRALPVGKFARFLLLCLPHAWMPRLPLAPARLNRILRRLCAYDQRKDRPCFPQFLHMFG
jgi:hypothetical protein